MKRMQSKVELWGGNFSIKRIRPYQDFPQHKFKIHSRWDARYSVDDLKMVLDEIAETIAEEQKA
jgi:hypothetical protein